ncbi:MAG: putative integral rane protein [Rickettsiaceae bacterium]|jgi:predicted MPP superfamily phosphohydrolase|nr:putative integral rane protein [Rickettsiaceae bacterium]
MNARTKQIASFLTLFSLLLGMLHFYLYQRSAYYLQLDAFGQNLLAGIFGFLMIITLFALPLSRLLSRFLASAISFIIYPWMGFGLLLISGFLIADFLWIALNLISPNSASLQLQKNFGLAVFIIAGSCGAYALLNGLFFIKTNLINITLKKLPKEFEGLRIAQITDLHIGPILDGKWLKRVVDRVNILNADIVAITGDLVDGSVSELGRHIAPLANLKSKYGVFFVTGNHEYYSGAEEWCKYLQTLNIKVLRNTHVSLKIGNNAIDIAGVDDWSSRHYARGHNLHQALAGRDETNPVILLAHQPITMHDAAKNNVDLQLSGHTHAGQIWPFNYLVYLQQPISRGLFQYPNSNLQVYVSQGTGFWGPPMRFGTFSEISCIRLGR